VVIKVLPSPLTAIAEMTDPSELARAQAHRKQFDRNWAWLKEHASEIATRHRGKYVVIAAEQTFVGDTADEAWGRVAGAEIDDKGSFIMRVPKQGSGMRNIPPVVMMTETTEPAELALSQEQVERFQRNANWLEAHGDEIFALHRGKYVCIAGEEPFVSDAASEALALAKAAHPEDDGRFLYRVPRDRTAWIYAS
jgi:hypothetical protein